MKPTKRRGRKPRVNTEVSILNQTPFSTNNVFKIEKGYLPSRTRETETGNYVRMLVNIVKTMKPGSDESVMITNSICDSKNRAFNIILNVRRKLKQEGSNIVLTPNAILDQNRKYIGVRVWRKH